MENININELYSELINKIIFSGAFNNIDIGYLKISKPSYINKKTLIVKTPSRSIKNTLLKSINPINNILSKLTNNNLNEINFEIDKTLIDDNNKDFEFQNKINDLSIEKVENAENGFNKKYTFENFISSSSSHLAFASSNAVAESPGKSYNPLFIYGNSGLGKTHLLHAIGNYSSQLYPNIKIKYLTSDKFVNDFIDSVKNNTKNTFLNLYSDLDMLLIDDIQFFANKSSSVEAFFHLFNKLISKGSQIVLTSDVAPKDLIGFDNRLISRFQSGLLTNVASPDLETRIAILQKKAESENININIEILEEIAKNIKTNVRVLEGALIRVIAHCFVEEKKKENINHEDILKIIYDFVDDDYLPQITVDEIIHCVANYFDILSEDILSDSRVSLTVLARQIAMYITRELTDLSLPNIGKAFNGKDHSTVIYAIKQITKKIKTDNSLLKSIDDITKLLKK